jgi:hypothetical protein
MTSANSRDPTGRRTSTAKIVTIDGAPTSALGLAAYPDQSPECVHRAFEAGINFFFFYGPGQAVFVQELRPLVQERRNEIIIASGSSSRTSGGLRAVRRKILSAVGADTIDIFFAEYINPSDNMAAIFGGGGLLDELLQWKENGWIRFVGASSHDRTLAKKLAEDPRVDVLMHRFNMAHRKAAAEVFPTALKAHSDHRLHGDSLGNIVEAACPMGRSAADSRRLLPVLPVATRRARRAHRAEVCCRAGRKPSRLEAAADG